MIIEEKIELIRVFVDNFSGIQIVLGIELGH